MCISPSVAPNSTITPNIATRVEMNARSGWAAVAASILPAAVSSFGETANATNSNSGATIMHTPATVLRKCCESETPIKPSFGFEINRLTHLPPYVAIVTRLLGADSIPVGYGWQHCERARDRAVCAAMRRLLPLLLAAGVLAAAPAADAATETASSGAVKATFSYTKKSDLQYSDLHLTIVRAGVTAFDGPTPPACSDPNCGFWPGGVGRTSSVSVVDLDGDGEPEVVVQAYSGGAHCCLFAEIYSYDASTGRYVNLEQNFGGGYSLRDLNGDARAEFKATDFNFDEAFAAHAASTEPIQILAFRSGKLVDVTRSFPALIRKDAAYQLKLYRKYRAKKDFDIRGILASYVADEYLLGKSKTAKRTLSRALHRGELNKPRGTGFASGRSYVKRLNRLLKKLGYIR